MEQKNLDSPKKLVHFGFQSFFFFIFKQKNVIVTLYQIICENMDFKLYYLLNIRREIVMQECILSHENIVQFKSHLIEEEKSNATIEKYIRDVNAFYDFLKERTITKEVVVEYKKSLVDKGYAVRSINSMLASLNSLFEYMGWQSCRVKCLKLQKEVFCSQDRELTKQDYIKLLEASKDDEQLNLIMQTICSTGIRVSELNHFTVETLDQGQVNINCKGKIRVVLIPGKLKKLLKKFIKKEKIESGVIFQNQKGNPINRCIIWEKMKRICKKVNINPNKVYPHNLRKLFARTFYKVEKDIAKLADILGHSSIDTTRIYIISTGKEHRKKIEGLDLVMTGYKKSLT